MCIRDSYHRGRWSPVWRSRMQRLDHTTIFVTIAVSYTPICLLVLQGWLSVAMLAVAWTGAAVGGVLFTVGAIFLASHWPDPFPRVFGYHEIWHVLVVAAIACHMVAIAS